MKQAFVILMRLAAGLLIAGAWLVPMVWLKASLLDYLDWYAWARVRGCLVPLIDMLSRVRDQSLTIWGISLVLGLGGTLLWRQTRALIPHERSMPALGFWFLLAFPACALVFWLVVVCYRP